MFLGEAGPPFCGSREMTGTGGALDGPVCGTCRLGDAPAPDTHLPAVFPAQELLQREQTWSQTPPRGDARLALSPGPAGRAKCCVR